MKTHEREDLLRTLRARFEKNMHRHEEILWIEVQARLEGNPGVLRSLRKMESTGGEPDIVTTTRRS